MEEEYIVVEHLHKKFQNADQELLVLKDINFHIKKGEFICIVGASGCGKSTLLRAIAGLDVEHSGSVRVNGAEVVKPNKSRGVVFQEHRLVPWFSVEKNVAYALNGMEKEKKKEIVKKQIELVGLKGFEKAYPSQLSGGMSQRAGIARALANNPSVLLLDEPFGALDAFTKIQMQQEMKRIQVMQGTTMILVTHDIEEAVYLADRVFVFSSRPGRIKDIITVNLPQNRNRNSASFINIKKKIYDQFFENEDCVEEYVI